MAIVTQPLGSSEARGSVGGLTYATWRGKHTVRTRAGPSREPTAPQAYIITLLVQGSFNWQGLTDAQRAQWRALAAELRHPHWTGSDKRLTGHQAYVRSFVRATLNWGIYDESIPSGFPDHILEAFYVTSASTDLQLHWTADPLIPGGVYLVETFLAGPLSAGRNPTLHDAIRYHNCDYVDESDTIPDRTAGYWTAFCRLVDTHGMVSPWQSDRVLITP